uniref:Uncharacterized protein n=1 Tax=Oryza sativa subsp. japonica TaxID=39947 RepID=Q6YX74_ORYSJ|nr:hypothetical protein [Oryza sativa Japonica Group]BAD03829.1 hypothetical protein [Oryza sativa Japonica Group]
MAAGRSSGRSGLLNEAREARESINKMAAAAAHVHIKAVQTAVSPGGRVSSPRVCCNVESVRVGGQGVGEGVAERGAGRPPGDGGPALTPHRWVVGGDTVGVTLDEFLGGKGLVCREVALASWTDVNADDPDMCPVLHVVILCALNCGILERRRVAGG